MSLIFTTRDDNTYRGGGVHGGEQEREEGKSGSGAWDIELGKSFFYL